jgi:hypothetical protein
MEHKWVRQMWREEYVPDFLPGKRLHAWQEMGVAFLHLCNEQWGFALLADTMGVGKVYESVFAASLMTQTIQTLAFIQTLNKMWQKRHPGNLRRAVNFIFA